MTQGDAALDESILQALARAHDGRLAFTALAGQLGVSPQRLQDRVRQLNGAVEDAGNSLRITDAGRICLTDITGGGARG
jgi:hypothetical protein